MSLHVTDVSVHNLVLTNQNTEYSLTIPRASKLRIQARAADVRLAYQAGVVAAGAPYMTVKAGSPPLVLDHLVGNAITLYFASGVAGAVVEAEAWA